MLQMNHTLEWQLVLVVGTEVYQLQIYTEACGNCMICISGSSDFFQNLRMLKHCHAEAI